jgi:RNA recognition motif-containing protein
MGGVGFRFQLPDICKDWLNAGTCKSKTKTCPNRPCCGLFKFPELPREMGEKLEAELKDVGPDNVKLDENYKRKLKASINDSTSKSDGPSDSRTLFVSNLTEDADENQIKGVFSKFPGLLRANVTSSKNGKIAFVEYSTRTEAQTVLSLSGGLRVGSAAVHLSWARTQSNSHDTGFASSSKAPNNYDDNFNRRPGKVNERHQEASSGNPQEKRVPNAKPSSSDETFARKKQKLIGSDTHSKSTAQPPAPDVLLNALKMRKAKGLEDDD